MSPNIIDSTLFISQTRIIISLKRKNSKVEGANYLNPTHPTHPQNTLTQAKEKDIDLPHKKL